MTVHLTAAESGQRLDVWLSSALSLTRSTVQRLLASGAVSAGGKTARKNDKTVSGRTYTVGVPETPAVADAQPQAIPLDIVFEDMDVIVVNKPRGMVVHPAPGHPDGTLVNALLAHCGPSLSGIGGVQRPGIVHRIDKDTSGLLIAAKNDTAHQFLARQLKDHTLSRIYEAVVIGHMREDCGTIDAPIGRHPTDRKRQAVNVRIARPAVTHYQVLARYKGYTHVRCQLETGRTHQIRVHMASIGHPLLGDLVYGRKKLEMGLSGQCLHAKELTFVHPLTRETMHLTTQLPAYFCDVLARLGPPLD